ASINRSAPTFASGIMNEYRRYAIGALEWRRDLAVEAAAHLLRYGRHFDEAGMPAIFGAAAEDVADLAIEARIRDPQVSCRLAQTTGNGAVVDLEGAPAVAKDLVPPEPASALPPTPQVAG